MEGFPLNLNDTFTSTRGCAEPMFFPQHILPCFSFIMHNGGGMNSYDSSS